MSAECINIWVKVRGLRSRVKGVHLGFAIKSKLVIFAIYKYCEGVLVRKSYVQPSNKNSVGVFCEETF